MARGEKIYIGAENRTVRELTKAGQALTTDEKAAVLRVQAWINNNICLDTEDATHPISYDDGKVTMQAGLIEGLEAGAATIYLTVFDAEHTTGLAWGSFSVEIIDWPKCEAGT